MVGANHKGKTTYLFFHFICLMILQIRETPIFERRRADPKNVASIILGGGAGTQLFPLTSRTATPAVSEL